MRGVGDAAGGVDSKAMERGPYVKSLTICTRAYIFRPRDELARLKEDGIHHPNLNLFLINRYSACSAL